MWSESQPGTASQVSLGKLFLHTSVTCSLGMGCGFPASGISSVFVKHSAELGRGAGTAREPLAEGRAQVPASTWGGGFSLYFLHTEHLLEHELVPMPRWEHKAESKTQFFTHLL